MSTRLVTRIGLVGDDERSADALDVTAVVEPTSGAVLRTRGSLFGLVQVSGTDPRLRAAARDALADLERHYYGDLTSGPAEALTNALRAVNRGVYHRRDRLGIPQQGGIGVVALAVRGRTGYVVRLGPAGALILRDARMHQLPPGPVAAERDPLVAERREAATLGEAQEIDPFHWHGQLLSGDRIALLSGDLADVVGTEELKRGLAALPPVRAAERLQRLFAARGGRGSDGLLVLEVAELPVTVGAHRPSPVRLDQPLAGLEDRGPVPLADAAGSLRRRADRAGGDLRSRAGRALIQLLNALFVLVPPPRPELPQVQRTSLREGARRRRRGLIGIAAVALLLALGISVAGLPGVEPTEAIPRARIARQAVLAAEARLAELEQRADAEGLFARDPERAAALLQESYAELERAVAAGVATEELEPLRSRADRASDSLYRVTRLAEIAVVVDLAATFEFIEPARMVAASDASLWLTDAARGRLLRIDPASGEWQVVLRAGEAPAGGSGRTAGEPWLLATAADTVVVVDRLRQAWRIELGEHLPRPMQLNGAEDIVADARLLAALQHLPPLRIFTLYLLDPGGQVLRWTPPAVLPVEFPAPPEAYLSETPDPPASEARAMIVDANLWLLHRDTVTRVGFGRPLAQDDYRLDPPPDGALRAPLDYRLIDAATVGDRELLYVYDAANRRIIAFGRGDGAFVRQWLAPRRGPQAAALDEVRALVVESTADGPPIAYLLVADRVLRVVLE